MELKIKRENVIVPIVSALLIVIISNLKIDWYFKTIMFPFFMILMGLINYHLKMIKMMI